MHFQGSVWQAVAPLDPLGADSQKVEPFAFEETLFPDPALDPLGGGTPRVVPPAWMNVSERSSEMVFIPATSRSTPTISARF